MGAKTLIFFLSLVSWWGGDAAAGSAAFAFNAQLSEDQRFVIISGTGLEQFRAGWAVTIIRGSQKLVLSSSEGGVSHDAPGVIQFPEAGLELLFHLHPRLNEQAAFIQVGLRNTGTSSLKFLSATPVLSEFSVTGDGSDWLITGLHPHTPALTALNEIQTSVSVYEYGTCYRSNGDGFLFGPVGTPTAYLNTRFSNLNKKKVTMSISADMSGVQVDPGETRWGQEVALVFQPPKTALPHWVEWVSQSHGMRANRAITGWNNGNALINTDIHQEILAVTQEVQRSGNRLRPELIQIENVSGDPGNLKTLDAPWIPECAQRVSQIGAHFGIRLGFDKMTDLQTITDTVQKAVLNGFTYIKIFHPMTALPHDPKRTDFEVYRDEFAAIRHRVGENIYLCYCDDAPNRAVVGLVDSSRVGFDARRDNLRPAIDNLIRSSPLVGHWFAADVDDYYLGTWRANDSRISEGWQAARMWMSLTALLGCSAVTSDPWYQDNFKPFWMNFEALSPPCEGQAAVPELGLERKWGRVVKFFHREWGDWAVVFLRNPGNTDAWVKLDFAQIGLNPQRSYAVWGFWDNRLLGVVQGSWSTRWLTPADIELIRLTEVDPHRLSPFLIGSNLHLSCGAEEIKGVKATPSSMIIELTDAGAQHGTLFIHSWFPPVLRSIKGCTVSDISMVQPNFWRIQVNNREQKTTQRIELAFLVPLTYQVWFWVLVSLIVICLIVSLWLYITHLKLQRNEATTKDRARIARDLHDDLGANLTQISYESDYLLSLPGLPAHCIEPIQKMRTKAMTLTQALDEIVWAVDSKKDTFESLVGYLASYAQEILSGSGIACRFDFPDELTACVLSPEIRHNVFLAYKEALYNIIRHANASEVNFALTIRSKECEFSICDNGKGLNHGKSSIRAGGGHGLNNMKARMNALGGNCIVKNSSVQGTEVILTWKLI